MAICESCHSFKVFGRKCWFFWDNKRTCTQHRKSAESGPDYASEELIILR